MIFRRILALAACLACMCVSAFAETFVSGNEALGYLIADGETREILVAPGEYEAIFPAAGRFFAAKTQEGWLLLDKSGMPAREEIWQEIQVQGGCLLLKKDGFFGIYNENLSAIYEHNYTQVISNGEGGFLALKTEPNDDRGDGVYFLDGSGGETATGTVVVYGLNPFSCALSAAVASGGKKMGYLGPDGKWAVSAQYGYGGMFARYGLAVASADSGAGVIDEQGNWAISPKFETVSITPDNAIAAVYVRNGCGLYDMEARKGIVELSGTSVHVRTRELRDMALVTVDGTAYLYARSGEILAQWPESEGAAVRMLGQNHMQLLLGGSEYLLDESAAQLAGPYEEIAQLCENRFAARGEGKIFVLDEMGKVLWEAEAEAITAGTDEFCALWTADEVSILEIDG